MENSQSKALGLLAVAGLAMIFTFQNCAPAKLTGDGALGTTISNSISTVGRTVDLNALMASAVEDRNNVLYPQPGVVQDSGYAVNNKLIENVLLKANDYNRIEWVQESTGLVLSNGEVLSAGSFQPEMAGVIYVVGYRADQAFLLARYRLIARGSTTLNANSVGAVSVSQKAEPAASGVETHSILISTPNVSVESIQFLMKPSGEVIQNQRALRFSKPTQQAGEVVITVRDEMGQTFSRTLSYPAATSPVATPTPTPTPVMTPAPTPVPTPTPAPLVRLRTRVNMASFVDSASNTTGSLVHLWSLANNNNQAFRFASDGSLQVHGKCLAPTGGETSRITLADCNGAASQKWTHSASTGQIQHTSTGHCMDLVGAPNNGAHIIVYRCHGDLNQQWDLVPH